MDSIITLILHICMLPRVLLLHWMPPCLGLVTRDPPPRVEGGLPPPGYSRGLCGLEMLASTLSLGASFPGALGTQRQEWNPLNQHCAGHSDRRHLVFGGHMSRGGWDVPMCLPLCTHAYKR